MLNFDKRSLKKPVEPEIEADSFGLGLNGQETLEKLSAAKTKIGPA